MLGHRAALDASTFRTAPAHSLITRKVEQHSMKLLVYGATRGYVPDSIAELLLEYGRLLVGRRTADALTLQVIAEDDHCLCELRVLIGVNSPLSIEECGDVPGEPLDGKQLDDRTTNLRLKEEIARLSSSPEPSMRRR